MISSNNILSHDTGYNVASVLKLASVPESFDTAFTFHAYYLVIIFVRLSLNLILEMGYVGDRNPL
jgi:hypothetical protein